jgi:hypothetical protein
MRYRASLRRALRTTGAGIAAVAVAGALGLGPAGPAAAVPAGAGPPPADPDQVLIEDADAPHTYQFAVPVPDGGRLQALPREPDRDHLAGPILVVDATGTPVGAYDEAWAQDAAGQPVATSFRIEGDSLIQTVAFGPDTAFPVVIDPSYAPVGQPASGFAPDGFVSVPSHYVYNPALGALHDYCTMSPDEFPNPVGSNADFRGPCARHDLCYAGSTSEFTCDNRLYSDMIENCNFEYAWYNPVRYACHDTAAIYWAAVVAF